MRTSWATGTVSSHCSSSLLGGPHRRGVPLQAAQAVTQGFGEAVLRAVVDEQEGPRVAALAVDEAGAGDDVLALGEVAEERVEAGQAATLVAHGVAQLALRLG